MCNAIPDVSTEEAAVYKVILLAVFLCVLGCRRDRARYRNMRIMGLDYGSVTVGVAISDELLLTAQGKEVIRREKENKLRRTMARIEELVKEYGVETIVLGFPKNMNNTIGERAEKSKEFSVMLERRTGLPVVLWDERLTTAAAHRSLIEGNMRREKRSQVVDEIAAVFILQGYLDYLYNEKR